MSHCDDVEREFETLRDYFRNCRKDSFDLQVVMKEIRDLARMGARTTYGDLMSRHHISRARKHGIAEVLWIISEREACRAGLSHSPPHFISAVVVRASTGYPSGGLFALTGIPSDLARREWRYGDSHLTLPEKRYVESLWEHLRSCSEGRT